MFDFLKTVYSIEKNLKSNSYQRVENEILKEIYITYMAMPQHINYCADGHNIRPFLGHHNYIVLSLSVICLEVEKKIFKEIMHFHYMTYMTMACTRTPVPGVVKSTICLTGLSKRHFLLFTAYRKHNAYVTVSGG